MLARELGVSERHLRRRATAELGYGPKTFARIVRFQRALALLRAGQPAGRRWRPTAGYADQPHLTREVTALAGRTPGAVRADAGADGRFRSRPPAGASPSVDRYERSSSSPGSPRSSVTSTAARALYEQSLGLDPGGR